MERPMTSHEESKPRNSGVLLGRIAAVVATRRKLPFLCRGLKETLKPCAPAAPETPFDMALTAPDR
jgi:hypothetical protein